MIPYPIDIISNPGKSYVNPDEKSLFVRAVDSITEDDIQDNELIPKFVEKILAPNGNRGLYSLSVSLYGEYKGAYVRFWVRNDYALQYWDKKEVVDVSKIEYSLVEKSPVYIQNALTEGNFPITTQTQQKTFTKSYCCKFVYAPTNCNFWHFELKLFEDGNAIPLKYKGNAETKNIAKKIAEDLLLFVDEELTIPKELCS